MPICAMEVSMTMHRWGNRCPLCGSENVKYTGISCDYYDGAPIPYESYECDDCGLDFEELPSPLYLYEETRVVKQPEASD